MMGRNLYPVRQRDNFQVRFSLGGVGPTGPPPKPKRGQSRGCAPEPHLTLPWLYLTPPWLYLTPL